ncbi:MAG: hypothetical protein K8T10_15235 [Candidatus Eremiobacteraeota bacterium]|nr:hypothetical protein [Candidatus Eremiobacteraeota bacterium]
MSDKLYYKCLVVFIILFATIFLLRRNIDAGNVKRKDRATFLVHRFFTFVYRRKYKKAYQCFGKSVRREVSLSRFKEGAQDVRYLKILKIDVLDEEENLIKMRIRALIRLVHKGELYEATYEGKVDVYRENKNWKLITVDLRATSQKPLGKKPNPKQIQKLDFGTR